MITEVYESSDTPLPDVYHVMLHTVPRRGSMDGHTFISPAQAREWLEQNGDKAKSLNFTVCYVTHELMGPDFLDGAMKQHVTTIYREMTVKEFLHGQED